MIVATACMAMALLSTSCGGGGSMAADPISAAGFAVSPTTLTFGNQAVGTTSTTQTATLRNAGTATLNISSVQVTGPNASDFSATNSCGSSLAPSAQCTFSVTLRPTAVGTRTASVVFTDNANGSPQSVNLTGKGTAAGVDLSANTLTFGNQLQGTTSAAQPLTLTNSGNAALSISSIAVSGTNASDFVQTNNCGAKVAAGANCTISVTFTPAATGTRTAAITLTDNATGSPQTVSLNGMGTAPSVSISPTSLTFASQVVGTASAAQSITLNNTGNSAMSITSIALTGTNHCDFAQSNTCGSSVAAGANCTISVTFTPAATGTRSAAVTLTDNATGSPQTVSLTGTGTAAVASLSPTSLAFASQAVGATSAAQTITLNNTGNSALSISSLVAFTNGQETNEASARFAMPRATTAVNLACYVTSAPGTKPYVLTVYKNESAPANGMTISIPTSFSAPGVVHDYYAATGHQISFSALDTFDLQYTQVATGTAAVISSCSMELAAAS